jgi:hypothetical protein
MVEYRTQTDLALFLSYVKQMQRRFPCSCQMVNISLLDPMYSSKPEKAACYAFLDSVIGTLYVDLEDGRKRPIWGRRKARWRTGVWVMGNENRRTTIEYLIRNRGIEAVGAANPFDLLHALRDTFCRDG